MYEEDDTSLEIYVCELEMQSCGNKTHINTLEWETLMEGTLTNLMTPSEFSDQILH